MSDDDVWGQYDLWNEAVLGVVFPELEIPEPGRTPSSRTTWWKDSRPVLG